MLRLYSKIRWYFSFKQLSKMVLSFDDLDNIDVLPKKFSEGFIAPASKYIELLLCSHLFSPLTFLSFAGLFILEDTQVTDTPLYKIFTDYYYSKPFNRYWSECYEIDKTIYNIFIEDVRPELGYILSEKGNAEDVYLWI